VYRQRPELEQSASSFADAPLLAETSRQVDLEIERAWSDRSRVVVTAYRRRDRDGLRLTGDAFQRDAAGLHAPSLTPRWRNTLQTRASGIEMLAQRRSPTGLSGWIAYAYATSRVEDTTTGETWDADFDQRHTLNAHAQVRWSPVTSFSGKLRVGSNVPLVGYLVEDAAGLAIDAERNRVRLPLYARLDLRATRAFNFDSRRLSLFVEILNVLGRENRTAACACTNWADAPRVQSDGRVSGATQRLFPFLPSLGFVFDF
jgi:outer membrane receptor for ferrienterochelin and colicin